MSRFKDLTLRKFLILSSLISGWVFWIFIIFTGYKGLDITSLDTSKVARAGVIILGSFLILFSITMAVNIHDVKKEKKEAAAKGGVQRSNKRKKLSRSKRKQQKQKQQQQQK